ncbi:MAG: PDZ domain-containing protein [Spirosomataceae bacterium]
MRQGVYYAKKTLILNAAENLFTSLEITAYQHEKVIISGGEQLKLQWKPFQKGIYQAVVPNNLSFEQLFINGQLQHLARYPNYDANARVFHGTAADATAPERVKTWKNPTGGYVHALHSGEWGGFHYLITGKDEKGGLTLEGGWQNNRPAPMHKQHRFVENIREELDAPGEWYFDKSSRMLYFFPPENVHLPTALVEVSTLKNVIELHGTAEKPARNIQLKNLRFVHTERSFMETKEPLVRSDWTFYRGGTVLFDGTEGCTITDCEFSNLGGNAIVLSHYNKNDTLSGCYIHHIGASAVAFVGDPKAARSPSFRYELSIPYEQLDKTPGPQTNHFPQECAVIDNLIHDVGQMEKQATGVQIELSASILVSHNSIYNTPRAGINIGDGAWGGHILEFNDVFNTVLETGDHGAFNSWGRDRFWYANRRYMDSIVAVHPELILLDAQKQTIIRNNRFRCDHGWDIDLDDGSSNYHIYNNVCLNGGLKLREGFYRKVENNIMINNSFHPHVWFKNSGDVFRHNIVMKKYYPIQIKDWGSDINQNLFPDSTALALARKNGTDGQSAIGNPLFINASTGDYTVYSTSPAFQIGFRNFPMHEFGVQKPALKKLALRPQIPPLFNAQSLSGKTATVSFLGGTLKNVEGLGDRSAYGLPDETGVIVLSTGTNSLLSKSGLLEKDVIRMANGKPVKNIRELMDIYQEINWHGKMNLEVLRNQELVKITLLLK